MANSIPTFNGKLRNHRLDVPKCIDRCSGITIFGRNLKSFVFSTDAATICNINADGVIAVYPFTPQPRIVHATITVADMPVFVGVGGGFTSGERSVQQAVEAENQGCYGVLLNAPVPPEVIGLIKQHVDIPVVCTIVSIKQDIDERIAAGADILNVSAASKTPEVVAAIRKKYPNIAIIATGGPTEESINATIDAGANVITYAPPGNGGLLKDIRESHRHRFGSFPLDSFRLVCFGFDLLFGFIRMFRFAYRMLSKCLNRAPFSVCTKGNSTVT